MWMFLCLKINEMIRIVIATFVLVAGIIAKAQVSENRFPEHFSKIKASSGVTVFYTVSEKYAIKVETDDNEKLPLIKTRVENDQLLIYVDTKGYTPNNKSKKRNEKRINDVTFDHLNVYVEGPSPKAIEASSSADIVFENWVENRNVSFSVSSSGSIKGKFKTETAQILASSAGDLMAEITATSVTILASSSSDVTLTGTTEKLIAEASSSADCNLEKLKSNDAVVSASSSGAVTLMVSDKLTASASSSGTIVYYGKPIHLIQNTSSSGSIRQH